VLLFFCTFLVAAWMGCISPRLADELERQAVNLEWITRNTGCLDAVQFPIGSSSMERFFLLTSFYRTKGWGFRLGPRLKSLPLR